MSVCKKIYKDIIKIEFFNDSSYGRTAGLLFTKPFLVYDPVISKSEISEASVSNDDGTTSTLLPAYTVIPYYSSAELSVDSSTGIAGTSMKVSVEWKYKTAETAEELRTIESQLIDLQRYNYHLRVTYLGGSQHIVRTDKNGWMMKYKESKGDQKVTLSIENISGAQRVVD